MIKYVMPLLAATALAVATATPATAAAPAPLGPGDRYVALGDSYASGSGVGPLADPACLPSTQDYPALLARRLRLQLTDVTCSAATIGNMVDTPQQTLGGTTVPPQVDAVTPDTRLVTITAGGNDVGLFLDMVRFSCSHDPATVAAAPHLPGFVRFVFCQAADTGATTAALVGVETELVRLVGTARSKAPAAQIVLTDYLDVVPLLGSACPHMPLTGDELTFLRRTQVQLSVAVARAALRTNSRFVPAALLGAPHDACSAAPWTNRFVFGDYAQVGLDAYHPDAQGNAAIADAVAVATKAPLG
ncbi:SGNH/GDSL hydrolase family protein [Pseudonocardia sp.]|jgi:lysophospholipase L1-like esterase|uniref:SGNH/GDSL hydrolase family protein n=1 Tax=Pseudonocardia sp. TaxID=60912 RepID=UPI00262C68A0|nr:SGNH/GDSL hydrolase family protein [Pseudonocardia sp.]MCW2722888.1 uncharacterized protein [Pseudonocardia sp.]MDT7613654.1 hypothetical protein [Pseudonocardiales bacterium]